MKLTLNPIGQAQDIQKVNNKVNDVIAKWEEDNPKPKISWWNPFSWWKQRRTSLLKVTLFLFECVDNFIRYIENEVIKGADKKATVIAAVTIIYDYVVKEAMPPWAKPFAGKIKGFFIGILISGVIDFIVKRYNEGWSWSSEKAFAHIPGARVTGPGVGSNKGRTGAGMTRSLVLRTDPPGEPLEKIKVERAPAPPAAPEIKAQEKIKVERAPAPPAPEIKAQEKIEVQTPPPGKKAVSDFEKAPGCCPSDVNDGMRKKVHRQIKMLKKIHAERENNEKI
jgi:hypothetical protein